jgi:hypothetical protein
MASPPQEIRCDVLPFLADQLVVVAAPEHRLAGRSTIDPATLAQERFLAREPGSGTRAATERFFARHGLELRIAMELGSTAPSSRPSPVTSGSPSSALGDRLWLGRRLAVLDAAGFPIERGLVDRQPPGPPAIATLLPGGFWPTTRRRRPPVSPARAIRFGPVSRRRPETVPHRPTTVMCDTSTANLWRDSIAATNAAASSTSISREPRHVRQ